MPVDEERAFGDCKRKEGSTAQQGFGGEKRATIKIGQNEGAKRAA